MEAASPLGIGVYVVVVTDMIAITENVYDLMSRKDVGVW